MSNIFGKRFYINSAVKEIKKQLVYDSRYLMGSGTE